MFEDAPFINMAFDPAVPYNDLPMLPPPGVIENTAVLKACILAHRALAELKQICRHFSLRVLTHEVLPLLEAHGSQRLEGAAPDVAELLKLHPHSLSAATSQPEALRLASALHLGIGLIQARRLDVSMLLELASMVADAPVHLRRNAAEPATDDSTNKILYTPPVGAERLQSLLGNWERFVQLEAGDLDPLVLMAVAHYQLQAIQPFTHGNGPVIRLVDQLLLLEEELLPSPVLNLSTWYFRNRQEYVRRLDEVTQSRRWHDWILFYLKGMIDSAQVVTRKLDACADLMRHTRDYIAIRNPKLCSDELLEVLFSEPYLRIGSLVERGIVKRQTASVYLKKLCESGVLQEIPFGKEKLFAHTRLIRLIADDPGGFASYPGT